MFFNQKIVKMWKKVIFSKRYKQRYIKLNPEYKKADQVIAPLEINCVEKKWRGLEATTYALDGSVMDNISEPTEWVYATLGSIERDFLEEVCEE